MRWNEAASALRYIDPVGLAALMSAMWQSAAERGDAALLSNLQHNMLDPLGVANALDWAGVPMPPVIEDRMNRVAEAHALRPISSGFPGI